MVLFTSSMGLLLFYLSSALGISFICSVLEAVLLSTPLSFVNMKEAEGNQAAKLFKKHKVEIDRPITAILTLNTIAHTVGAAGVGAQAGIVFQNVPFAAISGVLTFLILFFSEITPKTIGAAYYRSLCMPSARFIQFLILITFPVVWLFEILTRAIAPKNAETSVSREELSAMVDAGSKEGVIANKENIIFQNIIKMEKVPVRDVMTPRVVCTIADQEETLRELHEDEERRPFSRIPVYEDDDVDNITGYVLIIDVMEYLAEDQHDMKLSEIKRSIITVADTDPVSQVWERLLSNREHIALVVDEYGSFVGLITMEDIMETILGLEILDEKDTVIDMRIFAREEWKKRQLKFKQNIRIEDKFSDERGSGNSNEVPEKRTMENHA